MSSFSPSEEAARIVAEQQQALSNIVEEARLTGDTTLGFERLRRWKEMTVQLLSEHISDDEARSLKEKRLGSARMGQPFRNLIEEAQLYSSCLSTLNNKLVRNPDRIIGAKNRKQAKLAANMPAATTSGTVFLIHGHDELNVSRLSDLLRTQWGLESTVLREKPVEGTTTIEQFEGNAQIAAFAIAVLSPDDLDEENYPRANPNIAFALGWFYCRLGQSGLCMVLRKGTKIHPALNGIARIEFQESIEEIAEELQQELEAADMLR